jgi:hypothetical protein
VNNDQTDPDDPVAQFLPNFVTKLDRGGPETFDQIRSWMAKCGNEHYVCMPQEAPLPVRLLDLSEFSESRQQLRLYITRPNDRSRYAALSYCWGYSQPVVTTAENLFQHMRAIQYDSLPQTLQDAVKTSKAIGLDYLWIDALCIIQNSERDKQIEIAKMAQIYQNASLTIVAACATSSAEGFLKLIDGTPPALEIPVGCDNGEVGTLSLLPTYQSPRHEALHDRAWTLQEIILSPRLLIFGKDCIGWKCTSADYGTYRWTDWNGYCAKAGLTTLRVGRKGEITRPSISVYSADISMYRSSQQAERLPQIFRIWKDLIKDYSTRSLTNEEDKLNAIAGIATYFQEHMNDQYLAGLWKKHLLLELSWKIEGAKQPASKRAPSWSWMALEGPVSFQFDQCGWYTPIATVISCFVDHKSPNAPTNGGTLVLRGWFGSLSRPTRVRTSAYMSQWAMQRHGQADGFVGVVMDCGMTGVSDLRCFGLATCVMETIEGHEGGGKSAWGLVLRGIQDSGLEDPVYKRVGWFSSFYWEAAQELSEVTIV